MQNGSQSLLPHSAKVIKPRERHHLEDIGDSDPPDSLRSILYDTSNAVNKRGDQIRAPPQGCGSDVQDPNGSLPQEPTVNASRGRRELVNRDIKQENEDLWKRLNCIVCMKKCKCVVFMPCGHMVLCWHCAVHVKKECPICRGDILDRIRVQVS